MFERGRALLLALYLLRSCTRSSAGKVEEQLRRAHERNEAGHEGYSLVAVGVPVDWAAAPRLSGLEGFDALSSDGSLDDVDRAIALDATLNVRRGRGWGQRLSLSPGRPTSLAVAGPSAGPHAVRAPRLLHARGLRHHRRGVARAAQL